MMAPSPGVGRRRRALQAAASLLKELDVDEDRPVDVFAAIGRLDLWLVFQPFESLLGVMLPEGGIMLTTERPPTIQRFTAAHEIAHWVLDHNPTAFDTEVDVLGSGSLERERLAQLFGSYFMMPPSLVYGTASRYGVSSGRPPNPVEAYLMARDMGVSYEAAVRQFSNLRLIGGHVREALLNVAPLQIKSQLAHGHRPRDGRADVWPVDERAMHHSVAVTVDDEIIIGLPENRSTGFRWLDEAANSRRAIVRARPAPPPFAGPRTPPVIATGELRSRRTAADVNAALSLLPPAPRPGMDELAADSDTDELVVVFDYHQADGDDRDALQAARDRRVVAGRVPAPSAANDHPAALAAEDEAAQPPEDPAPRIGATGRRWLALQAKTEGHFTYVLRYAAPYDPAGSPAATFTVEATVEPRPAVVNRRRLLQVDLPGLDGDDPAARNEPDR
ncbi:ImmA/IrrE family metallo-endopeptidase [Amycolatopsis sp. NBC_01480]|uniref:ImmA/IrrE family metallo-endopeptidase n=1 Tax=Amycolatopsis sp. NBC_01480 TaxID=2903562 RepID=UPI002E2C67DE|nr:ImmA/IrrE family metallo-endopeptidase [Amycolatopsis sp. NBC_01480]